MLPVVDSHCHLHFELLAAEIEQVVHRAREAGVVCMLTVCTKMQDLQPILDLTERFPDIYGSFGLHPNYLDNQSLLSTEEIAHIVHTHDKIVGIGETGLDYFKSQNNEMQVLSFARHIEAAYLTNTPLIIHSREAQQQTLDVIEGAARNNIECKKLIHCFTYDSSYARKALDLGAYISIAGIVTFKNSAALQDAVRYIPLERLLIETDSPYLAPEPHRGKPNQPAHVVHVCNKIAEIKNISPHSVATQTSANFFALFTKIPQIV